jgi:antirestriction protein ArdC
LHELWHATGHESRLDRQLGTKLAPFESPDFSLEELTAEMSSAFLCAHAGIEPVTLENSAAYIEAWIRVPKGDKRLVVHAAARAQRAADYIRGGIPTDGASTP